MGQRCSKTAWGVWFTSRDRGMLIGELWHADRLSALRQMAALRCAPVRTLLFMTRREARAWCTAETARYRAYPHGHPFRSCRLRPVRVRETVTLITAPR